MNGRRRFDGTPAEKTGLGKSQGKHARLYKREWTRRRRANREYREHQNLLERLRKIRKRANAWEIC